MLPSHAGRARLAGACAFVAACALWATSLIVAPYVLAHTPGSTPSFKTATVVYLLAGLVCHQQSGRSFHLQNVQWPVCARCAGLYLAAPLGAWLAIRRTSRRGHPTTPPQVRPWLAAAAVPTVLIMALEWSGVARPDGWMRALCAAPLGGTIAFMLGAVVLRDLR